MIRSTLIGHVHLNVRDLARAEAFYTGILGFRVTERIEDKFVFLTLSGRHHDLALRNVGPEAPVPGELAVGMYHFAIEVEDMDSLAEVCRRLKEAGHPVGGSDHGVSRALYFRDPEGIEVEVYVDTRAEEGADRLGGAPGALDIEALLARPGGKAE